MPDLPMLTIYRHDRNRQTWITLAGEIDLDSAPLVHRAVRRCLGEGVRTVDVDVTAVTFCDVSGLNAFLRAARSASMVGGSLRLHHPRPMLTRLFTVFDAGALLLAAPDGRPLEVVVAGDQ